MNFYLFFGIIIGYLFMYIYIKNSYHGENSNNIRKQIYQQDGDYYVLIPIVYKCVYDFKHSEKNIVSS